MRSSPVGATHRNNEFSCSFFEPPLQLCLRGGFAFVIGHTTQVTPDDDSHAEAVKPLPCFLRVSVPPWWVFLSCPKRLIDANLRPPYTILLILLLRSRITHATERKRTLEWRAERRERHADLSQRSPEEYALFFCNPF